MRFSTNDSWKPAPMSSSFFLNTATSPLLWPCKEMTNSASALSLIAEQMEGEGTISELNTIVGDKRSER